MNKSILVGLAILTLSTSAALAAHRTHHGRAMNTNASAAATNPNPYGTYGRSMNANAYAGAPSVGWWGGVNSNDHAQYMKNLHDSGYDPKNNFNSNGILKQQ
jgi:hypothetical protein